MKILELFGGIGACSKALENLGIDFEIADYVEIDKYAVASFNAIHNTNFKPQDICNWDKNIEIDLIMHGSPCQDFSVAGKQAGGDEGSGTRSSLMYETIRIVEKLKPKYVIWENVKNVISSKHKHNFLAYITKMRLLGYASYCQILNAKNYGIPQNRERVFVVSIRSDMNTCGCHVFNYRFPQKQPLKLKLKDLLDEEVDKKYYLDEKQMEKIIFNKPIRVYSDMPQVIAGIGKKDSNNNTQWKQQNRIYKDNIGLSITTAYNPYYLIKNNTKLGYLKGYEGDGVYTITSNKRGTVSPQSIHTITTRQDYGVILKDMKIRKLTPREVFRLMGFSDEDFNKVAKLNFSDSQLYKQAGNSIVVNVLMVILKELLKNENSI